MIAKTITLLESRRADHVELGQQVLDRLVPRTGGSMRVGLTGPPGVGKSSLIETLGLYLIAQGQRVAVLAVDPSSPVSGGSILGDKTRMTRLSQEDAAFIRPSPSGLTLGGVAARTREALLVCEAAGFEVVIIETVGTGQSEIEVASMVDFFCVLLQPGAGDELQGLKRGVIELADLLAVNKADGDQVAAAERARAVYAEALTLLHPVTEGWTPEVLAISALTGAGIEELWGRVLAHRELQVSNGGLEARRRSQSRDWLWGLLREGLESRFRSDPGVQAELLRVEREVEVRGATAPTAARALLEKFGL